jgi:hypothetical protein
LSPLESPWLTALAHSARPLEAAVAHSQDCLSTCPKPPQQAPPPPAHASGPPAHAAREQATCLDGWELAATPRPLGGSKHHAASWPASRRSLCLSAPPGGRKPPPGGRKAPLGGSKPPTVLTPLSGRLRCSVPRASRGSARPRPALSLPPAVVWPELRLPPTAPCPTLWPPPVDLCPALSLPPTGPRPCSRSRSPANVRPAARV